MNDFELKELLSDIIRGFSICNIDGREKYIKHFGIWDFSEIHAKQSILFQEALKTHGLYSLADREKFVTANKTWLKEDTLKDNRVLLKTLKDNLSKGIYNLQQIETVKGEISKLTQEINDLEIEKKDLVGLTAEDYVSKKIDEYFISLAMYEDRDLTIQSYSEQVLKDLESEELNNIVCIFNTRSARFNSSHIEKCSLLGNFSYLFYLCNDDPFTLFGKPLTHITSYQAELFNYAKYFKHVIQNCGMPMPDDIQGDPDKIRDWISVSNKTKALIEQGENKDGISTFGMKQEDINRMKQQGFKDLNEELKKNGGKLSMEDMMKMHGI